MSNTIYRSPDEELTLKRLPVESIERVLILPNNKIVFHIIDSNGSRANLHFDGEVTNYDEWIQKINDKVEELAPKTEKPFVFPCPCCMKENCTSKVHSFIAKAANLFVNYQAFMFRSLLNK